MAKRLGRKEIDAKAREIGELIQPMLESCGLAGGLIVFDSEEPERVAFVSSAPPMAMAWMLRDLASRIEELKPTTGNA